MNTITLNVASKDGYSFSTIPIALDIEDVNIKYVFGHIAVNAYDTALTEVIYYDEQASRLAHIWCSDTPYAVWSLYVGFVLITAERLDTTTVTKPMLINESSTGYAVPLSSKDDESIALIAYSNLLIGTFTRGDIVTGSISEATAKVLFDDGIGFMVVHPLTGVLLTTDNISNQDTPAVTADVDTYTAASQKYNLYEAGYSSSADKKAIVSRLPDTTTTRAITAVSLANNTLTIGVNAQAQFTKDVPFFIDGSTGNDGLYSVVSSINSAGNTIITVKQTLLDATADGSIK